MKKIYLLSILLISMLTTFSQVERKVVVEHFTNTRCSTCAYKNPDFYALLENYQGTLHIAYHPSSPYPTCVFNQFNKEENDDRTKFYGIFGGTPRVVVMGDVIPVQTSLLKEEQLNNYLGRESDFKLTITKKMVSTGTYKITLQIERVSGEGMATLNIYGGLAEKLINYEAPNGESLHHDVFRKEIFNEEITLEAVGSSKILEFEYTSDPVWDESQLMAYALVSATGSNEILQGASSDDQATGIDDTQWDKEEALLYPNPTSGSVNIHSSYQFEISKVEVHDMIGNKLRSNDLNQLDLSELDDGIYFIRLTFINGNTLSKQLVKISR